MKFGKKLLAIVLAGVLALTMLTACGGTSATTDVKIYNAIMAERLARGKEKVERLEAAEKLYEETARLLAERAAGEDISAEQINQAGQAAEARLETMTIDGKKITFRHKSLSGVFDEQSFKASLANGNGWQWITEDDYDYIGVTSVDKNGKNGTILLTIKLVDAE